TLNPGRTIGKQAAGIRVVGPTGEPVRFLASAVRNISRIVDFLPFFYLVGTISIIATARDQRLGDLAPGTLVIRDRFPGIARAAAPIPAPAAPAPPSPLSPLPPPDLPAARPLLPPP